MVQVMLTIIVSQRRMQETMQALRSLMLPLQAEPGFVSCRLLQEVEVDNAICYLEEWLTAEDLDRSIRSNHYTRLLALMENAAEPPNFRVCWVTEIKGLEHLEAARNCAISGRRRLPDACGEDTKGSQ